MASKHRNIIKSNAEYSRVNERLRGICAGHGSERSKKSFSMLNNMYVDYEGGADAVESIPGFRKLFSLGEKINAIHIQRVSADNEFIVIHIGNRLCRINKNDLEKGTPVIDGPYIYSSKSSSYSFCDNLYVMDGNDITQIDKNGCYASMMTNEAEPYVPLVRKNEKRLEEVNLLTFKARESFTIDTPYEYSFGTPGINYLINDEKSKTCTVLGKPGHEGDLYIPSFVIIGDERYSVTEISPSAFSNNVNITALYTSPNLKVIGKGAFSGCRGLKYIEFPYTLKSIGESAFSECGILRRVDFDYFPLDIAPEAFNGCPTSTSITCKGDISNYYEVTLGTGIENLTPILSNENRIIRLGLNLYKMFDSVERVVVDGRNLLYEYDRDNSVLVVDFFTAEEFVGREIVVHGTLFSAFDPPYEADGGFLATEEGKRFGGVSAIVQCTVAENLDGRIFLSGNPFLPGRVFFSGKDQNGISQPNYFGVNDYFIDGVSTDPVTDLLAIHGELAVFKANDDGAGTIFFHKGKDYENGRSLYPVSYVHGSIPVSGGAVCFFDEPLFLTARGVCALEKVSGSDYREVRCRSENITPLLSSEKLSEANVTEWLGYLAVGFEDRIYLADSRDTYKENGVMQYEWYRLSGIGTYHGDQRLYRYSCIPEEGYYLSDTPDGPTDKIVYSEYSNDRTVYFVKDGEKKIKVYPTEEFVGGEFDPATCIKSDGRLLFFGTNGGDFCVFNNDKRGVAPEWLANAQGFSAEEYKRTRGAKIHPVYYSFASHRVPYEAVTAFDDCDVPYLTKSTVRDSAVIKFKLFSEGGVSVGTETDLGSEEISYLPLSRLSFDGINFSSLTSSVSDLVSARLPEATGGWIEKRYRIKSSGFCEPFGVCSVSYRYKIKGKIKE